MNEGIPLGLMEEAAVETVVVGVVDGDVEKRSGYKYPDSLICEAWK